jgi:hypothetical protein
MVYRDGRFAKLLTGAYLIAVFAFGVASMKAMDRVFDAMWVKNNIEPISAPSGTAIPSVAVKLMRKLVFVALKLG